MSLWALAGLILAVVLAFPISTGTNVFALVATIVVFGGSVVLYFAPTINAIGRSHPKATPIGLINFFLGWTAVGWVVALAWSYSTADSGETAMAPADERHGATATSHSTDHLAPRSPVTVSSAEQLEKLVALRDRGVLTESEFQVQKAKVLGG